MQRFSPPQACHAPFLAEASPWPTAALSGAVFPNVRVRPSDSRRPTPPLWWGSFITNISKAPCKVGRWLNQRPPEASSQPRLASVPCAALMASVYRAVGTGDSTPVAQPPSRALSECGTQGNCTCAWLLRQHALHLTPGEWAAAAHSRSQPSRQDFRPILAIISS